MADPAPGSNDQKPVVTGSDVAAVWTAQATVIAAALAALAAVVVAVIAYNQAWFGKVVDVVIEQKRSADAARAAEREPATSVDAEWEAQKARLVDLAADPDRARAARRAVVMARLGMIPAEWAAIEKKVGPLNEDEKVFLEWAAKAEAADLKFKKIGESKPHPQEVCLIRGRFYQLMSRADAAEGAEKQRYRERYYALEADCNRRFPYPKVE